MKSARLVSGAGWVLFAAPLILWRLDPAEVLDAEGRLWALHALHLLMAAGVVLLLYLAGRAALMVAGLLPDDPPERVLLATCSGFLIVSLAVFLMAAAGALHPLGVLAFAAVVSLVSVLFFKGEYGRGAGAPGGGSGGPARVAAIALGAFFALLFFGSLLEALIPSPQSPDALAYNLAFARLYAQSGGIEFTPHSPFFFAFIGYWEFLLSALALFIPSDISLFALAQILHLLLGLGGSALAIVCIVRRLSPLGRWETLALGLFAAVLFAGMRIDVFHVRRFPLLLVAPKSDLAAAALQLAAILTLLRAFPAEGAARRNLGLLGGVLLGAAAGVKITAALAAAGLGAGIMLFPPAPAAARERMALIGWMSLGFAAVLAPLLAKNILALGNPVYPMLASYIGSYDHPVFRRFFLSGGRWETVPLMARLLVPSAPFLLLAAAFWRGLVPRGVYTLLIAAAVSAAGPVILISKTFPIRFAVFIAALAAACAACLAGALIDRLRTRLEGGGGFPVRHALPAAWIALFILAVVPTHLDNRLKRAFRTAGETTALRERMYRMSPVSHFQAGWRGRLPEGARPMTFYRPEKLFAVTRGWLPAVAIESPALTNLFLRRLGGPEMERALLRKGITHVNYESLPVPTGFPLDVEPLASHLRNRPPLWREDGIEIYALFSSERRKGKKM
ncbi:MAG: hypothetical protein VCE91_21110 [Nitrospinota bacterium]